MTGIAQDIKFAIRLAQRNLCFSLLIICTMALGIGALTAVFSVVNAVLLQPLPYEEPDRLVSVQSIHPRHGSNVLSRVTTLASFREEARQIDDLGAVVKVGLQVEAASGPEQVTGVLASPGLLSMLGVSPHLGRLFEAAEGRPGDSRTAVLSYRFWRDHFSADPAVLGRSVRFRGGDLPGAGDARSQLLTIVGVLPQAYPAPFRNLDPQIWVAASFEEAHAPRTHAVVFGRLGQGATFEGAEAELDAVYSRLQAPGPSEDRWRIRAVPLREFMTSDVRRPLLLLMIGGVLVLLVAAANTANLVLARSKYRCTEAAIRNVLGAGRGRLIRQQLIEGMVPAVAAGALGVALAHGAVSFCRLFAFWGINRCFDVHFDWAVLAVAFLMIAGTTLLIGLVPALKLSKRRLASWLGHGTAWSTGVGAARSGRSRRMLVASQVALAVVSSFVAVLLVVSVVNLKRIEPGFETENLLTARVSLPTAHYASSHQKAGFYRQLVHRLGVLPGVTSAGLVNYLPLSGASTAMHVMVENPGKEGVPRETVIQFRAVDPGYLRTMGLRLVRGHDFRDYDPAVSPPAIVVSKKAARLLWGDREPIGQRIKVEDYESWAQVVGIVDDVKHDSLTAEEEPTIYIPFLYPSEMSMVIRAQRNGGYSHLISSVRETVSSLDSELPVYDVLPMPKKIDLSIEKTRLSAWLMTVLASITLLLAMVGVYAATWYTVAERRREIGIRTVIGASPGDIRRWLLRIVAGWIGWGALAGAFFASGLARYVSSLLYGVEPDGSWLVKGTIVFFILCTGVLTVWMSTRAIICSSPKRIM